MELNPDDKRKVAQLERLCREGALTESEFTELRDSIYARYPGLTPPTNKSSNSTTKPVDEKVNEPEERKVEESARENLSESSTEDTDSSENTTRQKAPRGTLTVEAFRGIAKAVQNAKNPTAPVLQNSPLSDSRVRRAHLQGFSTMPRRPPARWRKKRPWASVVIFLAIVLLTIGIVRSATLGNILAPASILLQTSKRATAGYIQQEPIPGTTRYTLAPFGAQASQNCSARCPYSHPDNQEVCQRACSKLTLREYARRILPTDPSASRDLKKIAGYCSASANEARQFEKREYWEKIFASSVELLDRDIIAANNIDSGQMQRHYNTLYRTSYDYKLPPFATKSERSATKAVIEAMCLRANRTLTKIGLVSATQASDGFSENYYSELFTLLTSKEKEAIKRVESLQKELTKKEK